MRRPALALLLACLLLVAGVSALDGYDYFQTIEYAACDQEIYQQDIVIHRSTGTAYNETAGGLETWHIFVGEHCREDYDDVRFTNSTGELEYYLWPDYNSTIARFAVRLEGADAAGTLSVHYGNPIATTTSDGDATYPLFDHFGGAAIDPEKWAVYTYAGSSVTTTSGYARLRAVKAEKTSYAYMVSKKGYDAPCRIEVRARHDASSNFYYHQWGLTSNNKSPGSAYPTLLIYHNIQRLSGGVYHLRVGSTVENTLPATADGQWHEYAIISKSGAYGAQVDSASYSNTNPLADATRYV